MNILSGYTGTGSFALPATGILTADNGLNLNTATKVELGGNLIKDTIIDGGNANYLQIAGLTNLDIEFIGTGGYQQLKAFADTIKIAGLLTNCPVLSFSGNDITETVNFKPKDIPQPLVTFVIDSFWKVEINGVDKYIPLGIPT